jgi:hypothetical protein
MPDDKFDSRFDGQFQDFDFDELMAATKDARVEDEGASTRLKSRVYSALMLAAAAEGPLLDLAASEKAGRGLCIFEKLVEISPLSGEAQAKNYCRTCHGRLMGEYIENPPLYWPCCPYAEFKDS